MTYDEALASREGKLTEYKYKGTDTTATGAKALATGDYTAFDMDFIAKFYFDNERKLQGVSLNPKKPESYYKIFVILKETYGTPTDEKVDASNRCRSITATWRDEKSSNTIKYFSTKCLNRDAITILIYEPLKSPGKSGL